MSSEPSAKKGAAPAKKPTGEPGTVVAQNDTQEGDLATPPSKSAPTRPAPTTQKPTAPAKSASPGVTRKPAVAGETGSPERKGGTHVDDSAPSAPQKSATILGDYKLLKKLGQGGMGAVYKAKQISNDREVAIKVMTKELSQKDAFVQRFLREARVMAKLDHPNVLRSFDAGNAMGYYYLSIEYVEGGSVEGWLKKLGRFSVADSVHLILKCAEGLKHAHDKNMIHRDIKPDNILLTSDGVVKVADLGLAKDTEEDVSLTKTGAGAGTPIYMAPEQARDVKHVDLRADIYALGCMLYVFLTGQAPFKGETLVELITAKELGKYPPARRFNDDVPSKLDLIIDKMIAKDPKHRYADCGQIIQELQSLGLASERLSFLAPAEEAAEATPAKTTAKTKTPMAGAQKTQKPSGGAATKAPAAGKTAAGASHAATNAEVDEEEIDNEIWHLMMPSKDGTKMVAKKVTTDQLKTMVTTNSIDAKAQVSHTPKGGFRAIATYSEFQPLFRSKQTLDQANKKGETYRNKFKELEAEDARRRKWGWVSRMFKGAGGRLLGLLWIALVLGLVGGGGWFVYNNYLR
jgi:serine/threonine protein kinase